MARTGHGHQIPGSIYNRTNDDAAGVKRCGGVDTCPRCRADVEDWNATHRVTVERLYLDQPEPKERPLLTIPNAPKDLVAQAKRTLINYVDSQYSVAFEKPAFEVYVVTFTKILQHWKAIVITDIPDGKYYELTYDGDKRLTYVNELTKNKSTIIED